MVLITKIFSSFIIYLTVEGIVLNIIHLMEIKFIFGRYVIFFKNVMNSRPLLHFSGEQEIPGLTDKTLPRRLGPKRASNIRKLFNLSKEDDVRQYVIKRKVVKEKDGSKLTYCFSSADPKKTEIIQYMFP